jgi:AraC family transcriptional regulator
LHAWDAIQKSVDYVEENIKEELSIEELAKVII